MSKDRLSLWDALRFTWHSLVHTSHAYDVWHDVRTNTVRCNACGRTWGTR